MWGSLLGAVGLVALSIGDRREGFQEKDLKDGKDLKDTAYHMGRVAPNNPQKGQPRAKVCPTIFRATPHDEKPLVLWVLYVLYVL